MTLRGGPDFKTALGSLSAIATFMNGDAYDFSDQTFHCQTDARMFASQCREGTSDAANDVSAVSFDMSHGAQLLVHHLARQRDS